MDGEPSQGRILTRQDKREKKKARYAKTGEGHNTTPDKARQDKTTVRQDTTAQRQAREEQDKTGQDKTRRDETTTRRDETRQPQDNHKTRQDRATTRQYNQRKTPYIIDKKRREKKDNTTPYNAIPDTTRQDKARQTS